MIMEDGKPEWEVEKILDKKGKDPFTCYLVKWVGYPLHDATWERTANLTHAPALVKQYETAYKGAQ